MPEDLYAMLGVDREADSHALRWAYERKLAEAARHGALRHAQELDQAYEVLRNPSRRALYDRHGVTQGVDRHHPLERYAPPRAVPFRAWTPADAGPTTWTGGDCDPRRGRRVAVAFALLGALSWGIWGFGELRDNRVSATSTPQIEVVCTATPQGPALRYVADAGSAMPCPNGASPQWVPVAAR